jgi:hypothetical protein
MEGVLQFRTVVEGVVIAAVGGVVFWVMVWLAVAVQPLEAVMVTIYVPGSVAEIDAPDPRFAVPKAHE